MFLRNCNLLTICENGFYTYLVFKCMVTMFHSLDSYLYRVIFFFFAFFLVNIQTYMFMTCYEFILSFLKSIILKCLEQKYIVD